MMKTPVDEDKFETTQANSEELTEVKPKQKRERKPRNKQNEGQASPSKGLVYRVKGSAEQESPEPKAAPTKERPVSSGPAEGGEKKKRQRNKKPKADGEESKVQASGEGDSEVRGNEKGPRPKTAAPKYRKKGEADENDTPGGEEKKEEEKVPEPKREKNLVYQNPMDFKEKRKFKSKWEEYRHGDWRKGSGKTYVTLETVIPTMPDKMIQLPDEATFHKKQVEIEEKIREIGNTLEEKKNQFEEILDQKKQVVKAGDTGQVTTKELTVKFGEMKKLKSRRQEIYSEQEVATKGQADLIGERDFLMKKIDKVYNTEELVPKGIKEQEKKLSTTSGGKNIEQQVIKKIQQLKDSIPSIQKKKKIDDLINEQNKAKKDVSGDLPKIKGEMKKLQQEIDVLKEASDKKTETKDNYDKQLDDINERRKKLRDNRDKLFKEKEELRDNYYGGLILYQKQQYLIQDIKWMADMQNKQIHRKEDKERRDREYQERQERIQKEREERKKREDEKKQREKEKKDREAENKKIQEEQARQKEIDNLKQIQSSITDNAVGSNPMFDQISQCEALMKFCKSHMNKDGEPIVQEETKEEQGPGEPKRVNKELDQALKKGSIQLHSAGKGEANFGVNKSKKGKKSNQQSTQKEGLFDFQLINKFNKLKISAPLNEEDFSKTIDDLQELKEALVYWGKIIQRQNKIKLIRNSRKISKEDDFRKQAEEEEKFIENEKQKFEGDDVAEKTNLKLDKLKIAQVIDRENKAQKIWDHDFDDESDEEQVYTAQDFEEADDGELKKKGRRAVAPKVADESVVPNDQYYKKPKKSNFPSQDKFKNLMKTDEQFPALDNENEDDEGDDEDPEETPHGEISN